ncbi:MAG: UDP-N-acetylmuramate dehydrogenase [Deltaproteobacteria bacterium]|jgi:UDP-N-acetylmuramate dehydrogenase|nr:UDP-N-acetylmuramate dehydrogenase [Deltaproteobacteria bacterium]
MNGARDAGGARDVGGSSAPLAQDARALRRLAAKCRVKLETRKPLSELTSFRTGGPAAFFAQPADPEELAAALDFAGSEGLPVFVLGGGTNVLFDDLGFDGLMIRLSGGFRKAAYLDGEDGGRGATRVRAGAAASLAEVADMARAASRSGWARLRGIPGTVGGALVMNAGTGADSAGELFLEAGVLDRGALRLVGAQEADFRYRRSALGGLGVVMGAEFSLGPAALENDLREIEREAMEARRKRLPPGPSAGSVFRNPNGLNAGRLIEECALKGMRVGGAVISDRHANVIVNAGGATSSEIRALAAKARLEVMRRRGVELVPEILMLDRRGEAYP